MAGQASGQRDTTYLIMFSLFLKLLGFFVVMYSYAEFDPAKVQAAEQSLQQRFNISLHLPVDMIKNGAHLMSPLAIQNSGRSYVELSTELKTQIDFLSSEIDARRGVLILTVPARLLMAVDGQSAKSPNFASVFVETLKKNQPDNMIYKMQIIGKSRNQDVMMRSLGDFVQSIVSQDYPPRYLTIGFEDGQTDEPTVSFVVEAVPQ